MKPAVKLMRDPVPTGFMRNGNFGWPVTIKLCEICDAHFDGPGRRCLEHLVKKTQTQEEKRAYMRQWRLKRKINGLLPRTRPMRSGN